MCKTNIFILALLGLLLSSGCGYLGLNPCTDNKLFYEKEHGHPDEIHVDRNKVFYLYGSEQVTFTDLGSSCDVSVYKTH